ncbi:hypothetical protein TNCV_346311 [Trichonephila clavipes]|nr:hypothetical protein TNCV_346311 [Trichonephila clavipes]
MAEEKMASQSQVPKINPFIDLERQEKIKTEEDKLKKQNLNADMKLSLGRAGVLPREPSNDVGVPTNIPVSTKDVGVPTNIPVPTKDVGVPTNIPVPTKDVGVPTNIPVPSNDVGVPTNIPVPTKDVGVNTDFSMVQWTHSLVLSTSSGNFLVPAYRLINHEYFSNEDSDMEESSSIEYSDMEESSSEEDSDIEEIPVPEREVEIVDITSD